MHACHEAVTSPLLPSRGRSDQLTFMLEDGLEANKAANANFSGLTVRADTNSDHLVLVATLSPAILIPCCPGNTP